MSLNDYAKRCHSANDIWWYDENGRKLDRNKGELIALIHSETSELLEGERTGIMDKHLPDRKNAEVELADILIRVFDYAGAYGYDLEGAFQEKLNYNAIRFDHKRENRNKPGGKKF